MQITRHVRGYISSGVFLLSSFFLIGHSVAHATVTYIYEDISGDVVWTKAHGPYVVMGVTIPEGASLTIEPGAIIKASTWAYPFQVKGGTLTVGAPDAEQVIITSILDDTVGGDTNEDEDATHPSPGNWDSIAVYSGQATFINTAVRYGDYNTIYGYGQIYNENGKLTLSHVEFSFSGGVEVLIKGGTTDVHDCQMKDSGYGILQSEGGHLRFGGNTFTNNDHPVTIASSTFENDGNNSGEGGISISNATLSNQTLPKDGLPYILGSIIVPAGATATISPGVIFKMHPQASPISVSGTLIVGAPEGEEVVFTSLADDTIAGDTNQNGTDTVSARGDWCGVQVISGVATFTNATFRYGGCSSSTSIIDQSASISNYEADVTIDHSRLLESRGKQIDQMGGSIKITNSEIANAANGIHVTGGTVEVHQSNFHDFSMYGIASNMPAGQVVDATNNWWGDATGPWHETHTEGLGVKLTGYINFDPWDKCHGDNCHSSVMFLPGLEASRLYEGDKKLWEPYGDADAEKLLLNDDGKSRESGVYAKNVIDNAYVSIKGNIYKSFLEDLEQWKSGQDKIIQDYAVVPYDWRLSFDDILADGSIENTLKSLAKDSYTGKVTIVAHSNGGLLAKALIKKLGAEEAQNLIDNLVFVAVPQSGTPQAIGAILHGYDQGIPKDWMPFFFSMKAARTLANNMPGAYSLLPSNEYFNDRDTSRSAVITFEDSPLTQPFIDKYGNKIDTADEMYSFLRDNDGKVEADSDDIYSPVKINSNRLSDAKDVHQNLDDNWSLPGGISLYQIAGIGEDTLEAVHYWTGLECSTHIGPVCVSVTKKLVYTPQVAADGDGTVKTSSALARSGGKYWVNLDGYNNEIPQSLTHFDREHADILEVPTLRDFIKTNIITHSSTTLPSYISSSEPEINTERSFQFFLHSPLALSIKDSDGHIVSSSVSDIPGARYKRFGEVQYISVPASAHPTVVLDGEAEGSFTLEVKEVKGETMVAETTFAAIPNTADTQVTMDFSDGTLEHAGPLVINYDGKGEAELSLESKIGEVVTTEQGDTTSPVTIASLVGTLGLNGWYTSDVTVTLTATDNESASADIKTEYSLNNGETKTYTEPFKVSIEGTTTIQYFSTDKQGNKEEKKTETIKIDKTAPEAKISFNSATQKLDISGTDSLSSVSVVMVDKPDIKTSNKTLKNIKPWFSRWFDGHKKSLPDMLATLTDESGHTTSLTFEKTKDRNGFVFVRLLSIGYDGTETTLKDTNAQYKWLIDRKKQYQLFAASLRTETSRVESHYNQRKNETWIMEKSQDLRDDNQDDDSDRRPIMKKLPGVVVPYVESEKGKMSAKY